MSGGPLPYGLELIQRLYTLDRGRSISNENDLKLARILEALLNPSVLHEQDEPDTVWVIKHGLHSKHVQSVLRNAYGEVEHPKRDIAISDDILLVEWNVPTAGTAAVFLGQNGYVLAASQPVGTPTDGSWDDGAAHILATDIIVDALDKINEFLASLYAAPAELQGIPDVSFFGLSSLKTAFVSQGAGQNLSTITAGTSATVVVTNNLQLLPPVSPADQFSDADKGTLALYKGASVLDTIDLATPFEESLRNGAQTWPAVSGLGINGNLQVTAVGSFSGVPNYQKGSFIGHGVSFLTVGENTSLKLVHAFGATTRQTTPMTLFYDNGTIPAVLGTVWLLERAFSDVASKYLDGVKYYGIGDSFSAAVAIQDLYNRTYQTNLIQLTLPGLTTLQVQVSDGTLSKTRAASLGNDNFDDDLLDSTIWEVVSGAPTESGFKMEMTNPTPSSGLTHKLRGKPQLVRRSNWTVSSDIENGDPLGTGTGYQAGIIIESAGSGKLELVHRRADTGDFYIEAYYTPAGGSRTLHAQVATDASSLSNLGITNDADSDDYRFFYSAPLSTQLGGTLTFSQWQTGENVWKLRYSLQATNEIETNLGDYSYLFNNFAISGGRVTVPTEIATVPDVGDYSDLLAKTLTLDSSGSMSLSARLGATPLSVRGTSTQALSASQNMLVNTTGTVSTSIDDSFSDNHYRLPPAAYDTPPDPYVDVWDNTASLPSGSLQVYGGSLVYPSIDFTTGYLPTQSVDYSGRSGAADYYRALVPSGPKSSGTLVLGGVTVAELIAGDVLIDFKIPARTGWLSLNTEYDSGSFTGVDGDGCRVTTDPGENEVQFTFGIFSTETAASDTGGMAILRITFPDVTVLALTSVEALGW